MNGLRRLTGMNDSHDDNNIPLFVYQIINNIGGDCKMTQTIKQRKLHPIITPTLRKNDKFLHTFLYLFIRLPSNIFSKLVGNIFHTVA